MLIAGRPPADQGLCFQRMKLGRRARHAINGAVEMVRHDATTPRLGAGLGANCAAQVNLDLISKSSCLALAPASQSLESRSSPSLHGLL
jgi:hypothetical protein